MNNQILERSWRAIKFYEWLKENHVIINIASGVSIVVNDDRAILTLDEDEDRYPPEFKNASLFFISEIGDKIHVEALRGKQTFSMKIRYN